MHTTPALDVELPSTASVVDVAEYILELGGEMETSKLQSLVYLSQAHHLACTGKPLFDEPIEAWAEGPIVPALHELHVGEATVAPGFFRNKLRERAAIAVPEDYFHTDIAYATAYAGSEQA